MRTYQQLRALVVIVLLSLLGCNGWHSEPERNDNESESRNETDAVSAFVVLTESHVLLTTSDGRFVRSEDSGTTWSVVGQLGPPATEHSSSFVRLVIGADGSIWGFYNYRKIEEEPAPFAVGVSRDGGATFRMIDFRGSPRLTPEAFLEVSGRDPLILNIDCQLWVHALESEDTPESFEPFGVANPDRTCYAGAACADQLFVVGTGGGSSFGVTRIWMSQDSGATWDAQLETDDFLFLYGPTCGSAGDLWCSKPPHVLFRYDREQGVWQEVVDLGSAATVALRITSSWASDGDRLFVAGSTEELVPVVLSVSPQGVVEALPSGLSGTGLYVLRVGPDGVLWAGGECLYRFDEDAQSWRQVWPTD